MSAPVPTSPPAQFSAGDSTRWRITAPDYPATSGYSLTYTLHDGANKISLSSTAEGSDHLVSLVPADTAAYVAGTYKFKAHAVKTGERWFVDEGIITVLPDFTAEATVDPRTPDEIQLAEINTAIAALVSGNLASYTTLSGTFTRLNLNDLRAFRNELQVRVNTQQGKGRAVKIRHRFTTPR